LLGLVPGGVPFPGGTVGRGLLGLVPGGLFGFGSFTGGGSVKGLTVGFVCGCTCDAKFFLSDPKFGGLLPDPKFGGLLPEGVGGLLPDGVGGLLPDGVGGLLPEGVGGLLPEGVGGLLPKGVGGRRNDGGFGALPAYAERTPSKKNRAKGLACFHHSGDLSAIIAAIPATSESRLSISPQLLIL